VAEKKILMEFGFSHFGLMLMCCYNQFVIYIAQNQEFHERTKHLKDDCHLVRDAWTKNVVSLPFTPSSKQLADLLIKTTSPKMFSILCSKLSMVDIYAPT